LNKYLNAFKVFGIKVIKEKGKYKLESSLYSMPFTFSDIKSLVLLANTCENFPDEEIADDVKTVLNHLFLRMNNQDKNTFNTLMQNSDYSFYFTDLKDQIKYCDNFCKQGYQISVTYIKNKKNVTINVSPQKLIYGSKTVYLNAIDPVKNEKFEIPIVNILSIHQLPQKTVHRELNNTVVFKLKGMLAKNYKARQNEEVTGNDEFGNLIVISKNIAFDRLILRLMKYGYNCEVVSPKFVRDRMRQLIDETLNNYE